jgi:alpha-glucuronidase
MAEIFISYAREDVEAARMLSDALEEHGFSVFWDRRIPAGKRFDDYIDEQLQAARCVIVVWSPRVGAFTVGEGGSCRGP